MRYQTGEATLEEVAAELGGLSREAIRKLELRALEKLRKGMIQAGITPEIAAEALHAANQRETIWEAMRRG